MTYHDRVNWIHPQEWFSFTPEIHSCRRGVTSDTSDLRLIVVQCAPDLRSDSDRLKGSALHLDPDPEKRIFSKHRS